MVLSLPWRGNAAIIYGNTLIVWKKTFHEWTSSRWETMFLGFAKWGSLGLFWGQLQKNRPVLQAPEAINACREEVSMAIFSTPGASQVSQLSENIYESIFLFISNPWTVSTICAISVFQFTFIEVASSLHYIQEGGNPSFQSDWSIVPYARSK